MGAVVKRATCQGPRCGEAHRLELDGHFRLRKPYNKPMLAADPLSPFLV